MVDVEPLVGALPGRLVAVVGAGCSTESGIPDYRGEGTARRARNPLQHAQFVSDPEARRRYWARSMVGWPRIAAAAPNAGHHALADLERAGRLVGVVTQNVDGLHHAAGSQAVVELHGALRRVRCLHCGATTSRAALQVRLEAANPHIDMASELLADGDAEVAAIDDFQVVSCSRCAGVLMPDVVFFGGSVPKDRVEQGYTWVDEADGLLVIGSSLTVFSGFRFVKRAHARGLPIGIVNRGPTRADALAAVKVEASCGAVLEGFVRRAMR